MITALQLLHRQSMALPLKTSQVLLSQCVLPAPVVITTSPSIQSRRSINPACLWETCHDLVRHPCQSLRVGNSLWEPRSSELYRQPARMLKDPPLAARIQLILLLPAAVRAVLVRFSSLPTPPRRQVRSL